MDELGDVGHDNLAGVLNTSEGDLATFQFSVVPPDGPQNPDEECHILDEIIIAPEVMKRILGHLDMWTLKQVRLVCKSWNVEAQFHMGRRGCVKFDISNSLTDDRLLSFLDTCERKLPGLPIPFHSLHVTVSEPYGYEEGYDASQLLRLSPPLLITNLDAGNISLSLAIPLIIGLSSSLESLGLCGSGSLEDFQEWDPEQKFPQLRHLFVTADANMEATAKDHSPSFVALLVNSNSNLETFDLVDFNGSGPPREGHNEWVRFTSALLSKIDASNVKAFGFCSDSGLNNGAMSHLRSNPFSRLETLQLVIRGDESYIRKEDALLRILARSCTTLKELDLSQMDLAEGDLARFPICPNVQQLCLSCSSDWWYNFVVTHFPSLETMNLDCKDEEMATWRDAASTPSFSGLKRLRITSCKTTNHHNRSVIKLLKKFPSLDYLYLEASNLMFGCSLMTDPVSEPWDFLKGLKHLVVHNSGLDWSCRDLAGWFSLLSFLTGLESMEMDTKPGILTTLLVNDLPRLKTIKFKWDDSLDVKKLLEKTKGMKKVLILNCCLVRRRQGDSPWSRALLKTFFESAPNALCGCKPTQIRDHWLPEAKFRTAFSGCLF